MTRAGGNPSANRYKDYYTAIIDESLFYASQEASNVRYSVRGRTGKRAIDVFAGLLFDVRCGLSMSVEKSGSVSNPAQRYVASRHTTLAIDEPRITIDKPSLEELLLLSLTHIDMPEDDRTNDVSTLRGKLADIDRRLST